MRLPLKETLLETADLLKYAKEILSWKVDVLYIP